MRHTVWHIVCALALVSLSIQAHAAPKDIKALLVAAEKGDAEAQHSLGSMYGLGEGVPKNDKISHEWFKKAGEQGDVEAQFLVGIVYYNGAKDVPQSYPEALKWLTQAAKEGQRDAQFVLGVMYSEGKGVAQDDAEAVRWYRKAAELGDSNAQYILGIAYGKGSHGLKRDDCQSVAWIERAAKQGEQNAFVYIGIAYTEGVSVKKNVVTAYMWATLASEKEDELLKNEHELLDEMRTTLKKRMSKKQIAEAKKLAKEWKPVREKSA